MEDRQTSNLNYNILYCIYLPISLYYCLIITNDYLSNLIFFITLLTITSVFKKHHKTVLFIQSLTTFGDLSLKIFMNYRMIQINDRGQFDDDIIRKIMNLSIDSVDTSVLVYIGTLLSSWILPFTYTQTKRGSSKSQEYFLFLKSISNFLDFITPLLIYALGFTKLSSTTFRQWVQQLSPQLQLSNVDMFQQVSWSLITALFLILHKKKQKLRKFLTIFILMFIIRDHYIKVYFPQIKLYKLESIYIDSIKILLVLFFRIHNQTSHINQVQESIEDEDSSRASAYKKFTLKRKMTLRADRNHILVILLLAISIVTLVLTDGLGNIIVIIGIYINLPNYRQSSFRSFVGIGITISFLLQPNQLIYFIFLYIARYISTNDHNFDRKNWWTFIQVGRIIILLSKVSLLNFLIGLFQSQLLVIFTLMFRNFCSFFSYILVFMGTEDNYAYYVQYFIPSSFVTDILLWIHFIFLKMYNPLSTVKFQGTDITNIFQEYSIVNYFEKGLKVLKIFHWIAYIGISLMILNSQPCLFTLMRITPLLLAFVFGIFQSHRSQCSQRIWLWNFYTSFSIAFVKYFYLLSKYENLSPWLISMLQPLQSNYEFIGLSPPDHHYLWLAFAPDFLVIVINAIVLFTFKIQLSEQNYNLQRQRIFQEGRLQTRLLNEEKEEKQKSIHYLYSNYIQSIQFKFKEHSRFRPFLTDFILDLCFASFLVVFYLLPHKQSSFASLPYFLLFLFGYFRQKEKQNHRHLFRILVGISSFDLLTLYISYFLAMIKGTDKNYSLSIILSKYLVLAISVTFNQTNEALNKFYRQNRIVKKSQSQYLIFKALAPIIPNQRLKKQVLTLYIHFFKILTASFYLTNLVFGDVQIKAILMIGIIAFCVFMVFYRNKDQCFKIIWVYFILVAILACLWLGYYYTFICLIFARSYYMLIEQLNIIVFIQKYGITNKTSNQDMQVRVQQVNIRYGVENMLEAISQVKSNRQKSILSFPEDQISWKEENTYNTVIWMLPILCFIIIILGVVCFQSKIIGFSLFAINLISVMYCLLYLQDWSINCRFNQITTLIFAILLGLAVLDQLYFELLVTYRNTLKKNIGLFLILVGSLGYYYLWNQKQQKDPIRDHQYSYFMNFTRKRSKLAIDYWKKKCEMVSELGSQIHNQKKMASLRKLFFHKQNLGRKVQHLSRQLQQKSQHRKSRFENLEKIQSLEEEKYMFKKQQFQVYSNMLTFMSLEDLQYCYLHLNQYFKGNMEGQKDLAKTTHQLRSWVVKNFEGSLSETLKKWYKSVLKNEQNQFSQKQIEEQLELAQEQMIEQGEKPSEGVKRAQIRQQGYSVQVHNQQHILLANNSSAFVQFQTNKGNELGHVKDYCSQRIDLRLSELNWLTRKIVQNIQILGLIVTAGWNFFGGVYTIPTNIAIFSWAIILQTKTTVFFWTFLLLYSSVILSCKLLITYLPSHFFINFLFYYHPNDYLYEFIMIFVCSIQIIFLKLGGTSEIAYSQRQSIFDAFYRTLLNQASKGQKKQKQGEFLTMYEKLRKQTKHSFFHRVFSKGRLKPGKDLYPMLAILQVIILLYIFFFYDMMEFQSKNNRKSLGQILTVTQFSKNMILALFFQALIMVADRIIVSLNLIDSINQKLQNFFVNLTFSNELKYQPLNEDQLQKLARYDYLLIIKYIFHVLLLVAINFFVYFYIPSGGMQKSIIPQCQTTVCGKSYTFLSIFLMLYLIYFVISGLQIKHGFNRNKCRNTLMERYNWIDYYIYLIFTGIPFLWEFKKISDWTITATALPLFHWMKFQDINARMYRSKCQSQILRMKPLGKGPWYKYLMGPPGFIFILCVVFSPIIMYSSFNPFAVQDNILAASFKLQLVMNRHISYNFFQTSHTNIISDKSFEGYNKKILGLFDRANLYKIQASIDPDQIFMLSEPAILQLSQRIRNNYQKKLHDEFELKLKATVVEKEGGQSVIEWGSKSLNSKQLEDLHTTIHNANFTMQITNFYSPLPGQLQNQSIFLTNQKSGEYFQLQTTRIIKEGDGKILPRKGLFIFYKSSVKYKVAIGLFTFYLTYVVLINSLFKMYLNGGIENIIFQGCEVQKILFICQAVRSARILQNFYQEEYLYFSLVDLMRYPRMIKNMADDFCNLKRESEGKANKQLKQQ